MFGSDMLDVLIGLCVVYLLFSLLCSALNEVVLGHLFRWRAKTLENGVTRLLGDADLARRFFAHPLISSLAHSNARKPAYIPTHLFVSGLMAVADEAAHEMKGGKSGEPAPASSNLAEFRAALEALGESATRRVVPRLIADAPDLAAARHRLEQWFDSGMEQVSGWYKRTAQAWLVIWALIFTVVFNVDTIELAQTLANDPKVRAAWVAAAQEAVQTPPATNPPAAAATNGPGQGERAVRELTAQIRALQLPLGWSAWPDHWLRKICGLLLSAGAMSLGAPFWFDLLNKAVNLRAGVKPAGKKPGQPKKPKTATEAESPQSP